MPSFRAFMLRCVTTFAICEIKARRALDAGSWRWIDTAASSTNFRRVASHHVASSAIIGHFYVAGVPKLLLRGATMTCLEVWFGMRASQQFAFSSRAKITSSSCLLY